MGMCGLHWWCLFVAERRREAEGVRQGRGRYLVGRRRRGWVCPAAETDAVKKLQHGGVVTDDDPRSSSQPQDQVSVLLCTSLSPGQSLPNHATATTASDDGPSSSSSSHSQRGPSRRCTTMSTVDSTSPEVSNRTCGVVS